jgi:hypothetical protein
MNEATAQSPKVPAALVKGLKSFVSAHGGSATAVIEYVGRARVRIVVVGADGIWGDEVVSDMDTARAAADAAGLTVKDSWDRELTASIRTDEAHRLRMAGGRARVVR